MRVLIITSGWLPVPAVKGGAVESLVDYITKENEVQKKMDIIVISSYDKEAVRAARKYQKTTFRYIKFPIFIKWLDNFLYFIAKNILKKKKVLTYKFIFKRLWLAKKTKNILLNEEFDKVIIENHVSLLLPFRNKKVMDKYKDKLYYHDHNVINNDIGCSNVFLSCRKIITVSDYISKEFLSKYPSYNPLDVVKLPNVADLNRFGHVDEAFINHMKTKLGIEEKDKVLMFAGRLDETKGALEAIQAFCLLNRPNTKMVIVGSYAYQTNTSNGYDDKLHRLVKDNPNVVFTGFIDFNNMPTIYKMPDIMILPSIWDDPAPLTIIEALCSGCALITTNSGGIPEYAEGKAIILERDNRLVDNITKNLEVLLNDEQEIKKYSSIAYKTTRNWTIQKYYDDFIKIICDD